MRILIENSGYHLQNMGDVAMLQIAAQRIQSAFPTAELRTLTHSPERLDRYVGGQPFDPRRRQLWLDSRALPIPIRKSWLSGSLGKSLAVAEERFQVGYPRLAAVSIRALGGRNPKSNSQTSEFVSDINSCDLVVVTGGGFLTDSFLSHANDVLTTLELAQNLGKPTLMFGQGIGPLTCDRTLKRVGRILAKVSHVGIREQKTGRAVLEQCGIEGSGNGKTQVVCTGDDAVQLAYDRRPAELGLALGINLRMANYSGVTESQKQMVKIELADFMQRHSIPAVVAPISYYGPEMDGAHVVEAMKSTPGFDSTIPEDCPEAIIDAVGKCRLVVTGSYHAGVFALSQGIPIIGLVASEYYKNKFLGLLDQFGDGCQIVNITSANGSEQLRAAMELSYTRAPELRDPLLTAAKRQVDVCNEFHQHAFRSHQ